MTTRKSLSRLTGGDQPAVASLAELHNADTSDGPDKSHPFTAGRSGVTRGAKGQSDQETQAPNAFSEAPPIHQGRERAVQAVPDAQAPLGEKVQESDGAMTPRCLAVTRLDLTSPGDVQRLRELLAPEYDTLQARRNELLAKARGQYVLIHENEVQVHPTLDDAMKSGIADHFEDLFFVGRIDERELNEYLAT